MAADTTKKHYIRIRGANVNNLKNLSVDIPRDKFVVFTGLSGSGKSSLAFDTIYAECQRRYMDLSLPMQDSFWVRWRSRMWRASKVCHRPFPLIRNLPTAIPVPQ